MSVPAYEARRAGIGRPSGKAWVIAAALVAANAGVGAVAAGHKPGLALLLASLPLALCLAAWLALTRRELLVFAPFALALAGGPFTTRLPGTGGLAVYPADLVLALAVAGWLLALLVHPTELRPKLHTIVLSWPFVLLAFTILLGVIRGHARYGTNYLSEPTRLLLYAAIATAVATLTPSRAYHGLVVVFYAGTFWQTLVGLYHLATGTSQTATAALSTGGTRALALSTAMYLATAFVLALLNVELDRGGRRQALHFVVAALAAFDIAISLGRTTFVAVAALVPVLFLGLRHTRRAALSFLPLLLPVVLLLGLLVVQVKPSLPATFEKRLTGHLNNDSAVVTRKAEYNAMIAGVSKELWLGVGFGRPVTFVSDDGTSHTSTGDLEDSYLWIFAGGGLLALSAVILLLVAFFVDSFRRIRGALPVERALVIVAMSMVFVFAINALTGPIFSDANFALGLWIALLLPALVQPRKLPRGAPQLSG